MNVIIKKLKEIFSFTPARDFIFTCECGEEFDGATVEIAIKHEIDEKHKLIKKTRKNLEMDYT